LLEIQRMVANVSGENSGLLSLLWDCWEYVVVEAISHLNYQIRIQMGKSAKSEEKLQLGTVSKGINPHYSY